MSRLIDPIDRNALMVALKRKMPISDTMMFMFAKCLEEVRNAPTIEPEPRWIPFDERMPEDGQDILVTIHWQEAEDEYFVQFDTYVDDATLDSNFKIDREAFAWMPIPEPYREEGENR